MSVSLGLDDSAYRQSIDEAKAQTKTAVASMTKDYNRLYSEVLHLTAAYQKSSRETGESSKATKELKEKLKEAKSQLDATAGSLRTAGQYMESFGESSKSTESSLSGAITKATVLASAIRTAATKIKDLATGFVQSGMQYNAQIETYRTALTNMLGDAEKANSMLNNIKRDAARTPFSTDALVAANQYLLSAGENAEYSQKTILALGDAIKATGGGDDELNRMAQNLQQVANVGKASAVDIKQFAFAGINIYQVLADYTGKSVQEVQNMTVTYNVLTKALQAASEEGGRYYNAMGTQSQTLSGRITTLQDNAKQLAGELTTGLSSAYGDLVEKANGWITSVLDSDEKLQQLSTTVTIITSVVAAATGAFVAYKAAMAISEVITAVQKATEGLTAAQVALNIAMDSNPIGAIVAVIGALVGALGVAYASNEKFREGWNSAWSSIKSGFSVVADFILDKLNRIMGVASGVANAIAAIGRGENPVTAYNQAYSQTRQDYKEDKAQQRQKAGGHARRTSNGGMWSDNVTDAAVVDSDIPGSGGGTGSSGTKTSGSKTETVIASTSRTATSSIMTDLGAVTTSIETLNEKVKDSAGSIRDRVTQTTTTTGKEMVNGVATTYKQVQTVVDGVVTKTTKTYDDMSKSLLSTLTTTAKKVFDGITTTTQNAVETYADGSEHTKQTVTETGERIVDGVAQTYTKVITYVDGVKDKVTETAEAIDKSVKATEERIQGYVSNMSSASSTGFIGLLKNGFAQITGGDFAGLSQTFAKLLFGEVTQDQREIITKWLADVLGVLNEAYAGKGLAGVFDIAQKIFSGESIAAGVDGVTTSIKGLSEVLQGLAGSGEAGGILAKVGTGVAQMGGKLMGVLGTVVSFVAQNPIVLAIAAVGAGAVGLGIALWKKYKGSSDTDDTTQKSTGMSYKDIQDAYWYGNERAFAGYDYRTDPYTFNPNNSAVLGYQSRMQEYLAKLTDVVQQYLPDAANQQIVLQDGTLVGALAPGMDAQLGQLAVLAERGN